MNLETILNAMIYAVMERNLLPTHTIRWDKKQRQARAFRARILKMDAEKDKRIAEDATTIDMVLDTLGDQLEEIGEKDARIAEQDMLIRDMTGWLYIDQVIDTQMEHDLIGPGKEYADKEDWIESYINGLKPRPEEAQND